MSARVRFSPARFVASRRSRPCRASNLYPMRETRRPAGPIRVARAPVYVAVASLALSFSLFGCSSGGKSGSSSSAVNPDTTTQPTDTSVGPGAGSTDGSIASSPSLPSVSLPAPVGQSLGCLTNGTLSGAFELTLVDAVTQVNTQNVGENAPDAYYATSADKNTIAYFVFGKKSTVVVNGDGSWTGESGTDGGSMQIAADGTGATVKATIEGSDVNGQRAKPLTLDLVTRCGVLLPSAVAPVPVNTAQKFTEKIVEDPSTTPS